MRSTRDDQSRLQASLTGMFYNLVNWGNRVQIPPHAGDFRLMDRQVVEALKSLPERNRFMKGLYAWVGFNSVAMDYEPLARADGVTSFGFRGAMSLAITGIVAFSTAPLRMLTFLGLLLSMGALGLRRLGGGRILHHRQHAAGLPHHRGGHDVFQRHSAAVHRHTGRVCGPHL